MRNDHYPHGGKKKGSRESHLLIQPRESRRPSQRMRLGPGFTSVDGRTWREHGHLECTDMFQGWEYGMPELRLGGRRGLHGGTERRTTPRSPLEHLRGWDARDWRGIGRIKGRCQGVKGGSGHADCGARGSCLSGCTTEPRVLASSGWRGSWARPGQERRCKATTDPTCRGHLAWPSRTEAARSAERGTPKPACLWKMLLTGHDVVLCQGVVSPLLPPLQPGQQWEQHKGKLIFASA